MMKEQINIPYFSIRLLTLFCYFLPFVFFLSTCTIGIDSKEAFNKEDAIKNEREMTSYKIADFNQLIDKIDTNSKNTVGVIAELRQRIKANCSMSENEANLFQDLQLLVFMPSAYSLSGFGVVYHHKSIIARIILGISMFLTLITLLLWRIISKNKLSLVFVSTNIATVLMFIIVSFLTDVSVLYGAWSLLFLLVIQLLTELQSSKKNKRLSI